MSEIANAKQQHPRRVIRNSIIACLVLAAGFCIWNEVFLYRVFPKRWGVVKAGAIYRSGQLSDALVYRMLKDHKIERVIDLTCGIPVDGRYQLAERDAIEKLNIESIMIPLRGNGTGSIENYSQAVSEIHHSVQQGRPVLVHCSAGSQRTSGVLTYYLVLVQHLNPVEVVGSMRQYGYGPKQSPELIAFLNRNMRRMAYQLVEKGVLEAVPDKLPLLPTTRSGKQPFVSQPEGTRIVSGERPFCD
jgi:predicted protein tyrosine phosphatase